MKEIAAETSIIINAPIEKVWRVMLNVSDYPGWNSFVIRADVEGDVSIPGTRMKLFVKWKSGKQESSDEMITDTKAPYVEASGLKRAYRSYRFTGKLDTLGMVHAIRYQWLEQLADGKTSYRTREEFRGLLKMFIPLVDVQNGFERQAADLKRKAEQGL